MADSVGARIQRFRKDRNMNLSELALQAGVAKSYLSALESDAVDSETQRRPSAETLYRLAEALGVAASDLLGRTVEPTGVPEIPQSLRDFAATAGLPKSDLAMLASIQFRGDPPQTAERWAFIYQAIKHSRSIDAE